MLWIIPVLIILCLAAFLLYRNRGKAGEKAPSGRRPSRNWSEVMNMPTAEQLASGNTDAVPAIGCFFPDFGIDKATAYQAVIRADHTPLSTHWGLVSWFSEADTPYSKRVFCACTLQVCEDGRRIAQMALVQGSSKNKDASEPVALIMDAANHTASDSGSANAPAEDMGLPVPKVIYPKEAAAVRNKDGLIADCYVPYDWKTGADYCLRSELSRSSDGGHMIMNMWIREGTHGAWTRLISIDTGMTDVHLWCPIHYVSCSAYRNMACVRSMELSDMWARSADDGTWHAAKSVNPDTQGKFVGSYNFGTEQSTAWMITSGVDGLCQLPELRRMELTEGERPS